MQTKRQLRAAVVAEASILLLAIGSGRMACAQTVSPPPATQTYYQVTTIDIPGGANPVCGGVNDQGLVCGYSADSAGVYHAFLWQTGTVTTVDAPGWIDTYPSAVNNQGLVIGNYDDSIVSHAAIYSVPEQSWTPLPDIAGKPVNTGNGINNRGLAVGAAFEWNVSNYSHGVGWISDGQAYSFFTVLQGTGSTGTDPLGINDQGQVTGIYEDSQGVYHGFLKDGSAITSFDVPGAHDTDAYAINNEGDVSGYYYIGAISHGFVMRGNQFSTFDVPGAASTQIYGGNIRGHQLAGSYSDSSGTWHGFVATPEVLSIATTGTKVVLSWPVADVSFRLQSTTSLTGNSSWSPVGLAAVTNANTVSVLVPVSGAASFFRLVQAQ